MDYLKPFAVQGQDCETQQHNARQYRDGLKSTVLKKRKKLQSVQRLLQVFSYCFFNVSDDWIILPVIDITVNLTICALPQKLKRFIFIIYRVNDWGYHWPVAVESQIIFPVRSSSFMYELKSGLGSVFAGFCFIKHPPRLHDSVNFIL